MAFALFTVIFSLDVFGGKESIWQQLGGFLIHNIPLLVLCLVLIFTWKRPLLAGILCIMVAVALTVLFYNRWNWTSYLLVGGTPFLVGALYIIAYLSETASRKGN